MVMYSIFTAGRDAKLFPDPLKFDPERWRRDETHAFAIQPFGFGPGACFGELSIYYRLISKLPGLFFFKLRSKICRAGD